MAKGDSGGRSCRTIPGTELNPYSFLIKYVLLIWYDKEGVRVELQTTNNLVLITLDCSWFVVPGIVIKLSTLVFYPFTSHILYLIS